MKADLHIHTTASDGIKSVREIFQMAVRAGVTTLSITDHDNADSCETAYDFSKEYSVEFVPGVELSAFDGTKEYHILGYFIDPEYKPLKDHFIRFRKSRLKRAEEIWRKLRRIGVRFEFDSILKQANGAPVIRPHIAKAIVVEGYADNIKDAFNKYINDHGRAYVGKDKHSVEECISLVNGSGGVASMAHPGTNTTESIIKSFRNMGMKGLEVIHPSHSESLVNYYKAVAADLGLIPTGGSDYHGYRDWDDKNFGYMTISPAAVAALKNVREPRV